MDRRRFLTLTAAVCGWGRGVLAECAGRPKTSDAKVPLWVDTDIGGDARIDAIAKAMRPIGKPFHLLTIGPVTNAARLAMRYPDVAEQWQSVTCMAGDLDGDPECNARLDGEAFQWVCHRLSPRLVGMKCGGVIPPQAAEQALDAKQPASAFLLRCYARYRRMADWDKAPPERRQARVSDRL